MRKSDRATDSVFGLNSSSADSNKFYSILLDARAATVSESMYDIAEKLLGGEKDNAKIALDQLWALKKNMIGEANSGTLDLLINYYQEKMDVLRNKEEHIRTISKDSRSLLEEKRKKDEEVATVKQQIIDCTRELSDLRVKLDQLSIKEQELVLIEEQLKKELNFNENEIINGLYEIILSQQDSVQDFKETLKPPAPANLTAPQLNLLAPSTPPVAEKTVEIPQKPLRELEPVESHEDLEAPEQPFTVKNEADIPLIKKEDFPEVPPFPKSVVKTTRGRVIGEYYYDGKVYKNERHYIFNSKYFSEQLLGAVQFLKQKSDQTIYSEMLQMIQDTFKRISENNRLHFEVSTNEILNEKTLKELWQQAKGHMFDDVERFCSRLRAKIDGLGANYKSMLHEQMERYSKN